MESKHTAIAIVLVGLMAFAWVIVDTVLSYRHPQPVSGSDDCPSIPREQSTGSIRCWSGGELVYGNYTYHNGGVLCSTDGKAIKITGGKSLCVIESDQDNDWILPTLEGSPR